MTQTTPTPEDLARDLAADLALCDAATPGPWEWRDGVHTADQRTSDAGGIHTRTPRPTHLPDGRCVPNDNVAFPVGRVGGDPYWVQRFTRAVACRPALTLALDLYALDADKHFLTEARTGWPAAIRRALAAEAALEATQGLDPADTDTLLERWDATAPALQRQIVAALAGRVAAAETECHRLRQALAAAPESGRVPAALEAGGALGHAEPPFACRGCGLKGTAGDGLYCPACLRERCEG